MLIGIVIATPILGIIGLFIGAAIFYVIYKLLGGTGSYEGTVRFASMQVPRPYFPGFPFSA